MAKLSINTDPLLHNENTVRILVNNIINNIVEKARKNRSYSFFTFDNSKKYKSFQLFTNGLEIFFEVVEIVSDEGGKNITTNMLTRNQMVNYLSEIFIQFPEIKIMNKEGIKIN
jgi:hypothetical protein